MKLPRHLFPGLIVLLSGWVLPWQSSTAQILPDATLPGNSLVTPNGQIWEITGGAQAGGNLFHSFEKFSVLTGETAFFNHSLDIQNIFSRVTGGSASEIDGLIRANGTANLFLLNPNGIMFGPNARLDIGGSFFASTADRINFAGGSFFSATNPEASPVLTINVPIGLQFGASPGTISNQSRVSSNSNEQTVGLQVRSGKTLGLLGGEVMFDGGALTTEGGFIQVGSVAENSQVSLSPIDQGWKFGYDEVESFQNIVLNNGAFISTSTFGSSDAGNLTVHADSIEIFGNGNMGDILNKILREEFTPDDLRGGLFTASFGEGKAGNLAVITNHLHLSNGGLISASSFGNGLGGNLNINASGIVSVNNSGLLTGTRASSELAKAGDLTINTGRLIVESGGIVATSTLNSGQGGNLEIKALESVELIGQSEGQFPLPIYQDAQNIPSGLLTLALGDGDAGDLSIHTSIFSIINGAVATTSSLKGQGNAGVFNINASELLNLFGRGNVGTRLENLIDGFSADEIRDGIFTSSLGFGNAGSLTIHTNQLSLNDGTVISTSTNQSGKGGDLTVNATNSIEIINAGLITGTAGIGTAGNLLIHTDGRFLIEEGGVAGTSSIGIGQGGNLSVTADVIELSGMSVGKFNIIPILQQPIAEMSSGLFTLNLGNGILGNAGNITINSRKLQINDGAAISTTTVNGSQSGNITIHTYELLEITGNNNISGSIERTEMSGVLNKILMNQASPGDFRNAILTASFLNGSAGSIEITTPNLQVRNGGIISASTFTDKNGGNLTINPYHPTGLVDISGSLILTGTTGSGDSGDLTINTEHLRLQDGALILTSTLNGGGNQAGTGGDLKINADLVQLIGTTADKFALPIFIDEESGNIEARQVPSSLLTLSFPNPSLINGMSGNHQSNEMDGRAGNLLVETNNLIIRDGAQIATSTFSGGGAGNLTLNVADSVQIIGNSTDWNSSVRSDVFFPGSGSGGSIELNSGDLILRDNSNITTNATGPGTGGDITINTRLIVGLENSDITTNAEGQAGKITINFRGLFGLQERTREELKSRLGGELTVNSPNELPSSDITAFSVQSPELNGDTVFIFSDIDPTSGLLKLPQTPVDVTSLVDRRCTPSNPQQSSFINIGRGGKPATPRDPLSSNGGWVDPSDQKSGFSSATLAESQERLTETRFLMPHNAIVEAQGWIFNEQGQIILVGQTDAATPDRFLPTPRCGE